MPSQAQVGIQVVESDILWVVDEQDDLIWWMHKAYSYLKTLKRKPTINFCNPASLSHYEFKKILLFLHESSHNVENLIQDEHYRDILRDEQKSLVIYNGQLTDDTLRNMTNVRPVQDFKDIVQWWPYVLSFLYSDPRTAVEIESNVQCTMFYDDENGEDRKIKEAVRTTLTEIGVLVSVVQSASATTESGQDGVIISCGSSERTKDLVNQIGHRTRKKVFAVISDKHLPTSNDTPRSFFGGLCRNINDFEVWKDILVALNIISFSCRKQTCMYRLFMGALPKLLKGFFIVLTAICDALLDLYILVNIIAWFPVLILCFLFLVITCFPFLPISDKTVRRICPGSLLRYSYRVVALLHLAAMIGEIVVFAIFTEIKCVLILFYAYVVPFLSVMVLRSLLNLLPLWNIRNVMKDFLWFVSRRRDLDRDYDDMPSDVLHYMPIIRTCFSKLYNGNS